MIVNILELPELLTTTPPPGRSCAVTSRVQGNRLESIVLFIYVTFHIYNNNIIYLFTAIGLSPGVSGYFAYIQNTKLFTNKFKSGGLHEKHIVATWNVGNSLSVCL